MGVLNHLIAPRRSGVTRAALAQAPLGALLLPQFDLIGRAPGSLPDRGPTGSAWSRAYVLGAACASLQQPGGAPITDQACFATALDAFTLTYGARRARAILAATVAAAEAQEPEVEDGLLQGAADLALVAAGAPGASLHFATRISEELAEAA